MELNEGCVFKAEGVYWVELFTDEPPFYKTGIRGDTVEEFGYREVTELLLLNTEMIIGAIDADASRAARPSPCRYAYVRIPNQGQVHKVAYAA